MLWTDLSLQIAMFLLSSEHTLSCFQLIPSTGNVLYISKPIVSLSAPAKKDIILFSQFTVTKALTDRGLCSQAPW